MKGIFHEKRVKKHKKGGLGGPAYGGCQDFFFESCFGPSAANSLPEMEGSSGDGLNRPQGLQPRRH
jgi:hypothetical protein